MNVLTDIESAREAVRAAQRMGGTVGLVPTMGALHEGHRSLIRAAKGRCARVAVTIFVNPTQFGPNEDFARYPRDLPHDAELLASAGADVLFAPEPEEIYAAGAATFVEVAGLSDRLEGKSRPGHFRGVATVVTKLFEIVTPHLAAFGQKDAQQAVVVKALARDLFLNVEILVLPTKREEDGLAMSSRNALLSPDERRAARAIPRALEAAKAAHDAGEREAGKIVAAAKAVLRGEPLLRIDYVELVDAGALEPVPRAQGDMLLAVAVFAGSTRLIDNIVLRS